MGFLSNAQEEIAAANYPQIRLCLVQHQIADSPKNTANMQWQVCTPDTVKQGGWNGFSAVGYFFGRDIYEKIHVPIGLIESSWGGTPAETWTSEQALAKNMPDFADPIAELQDERKNGASSLESVNAAWFARNDPGSQGGLGWADPALDDSSWGTITIPQYYQFSGIPELTGINALIWFRDDIDLPASDAGKAAILHLRADDNDTTWINEVKVGETVGFQQPRSYAIPAGTLKAGRNVIAVRVLDTGGLGGLYGKPEEISIEVPGATDIPLAGPWKYKLSKNIKQLPPAPQVIAGNQNYPTQLFNGMIDPLIPFGIKGAIWYQGEANGLRGYQYHTLLPVLINDWRDRWTEGPFPFYIVQLANFTSHPTQPGDDFWSEVREAQQLTAEKLPNSGVAVTIDIGDAQTIHPTNKQEVGRRLSLIALAKTYGMAGIEYSGPVYQSQAIEGSAIRLRFTHADGLVAKGDDKVTGFQIAGTDHKWAWADAKIDGNTVLVSAASVPQPLAVRYAWSANPICNLYNSAGLPASPFRTDVWTPFTIGNK